MNIKQLLSLIVIAFLVAAQFNVPYGFYMLLKLVVCSSSIYLAYKLLSQQNQAKITGLLLALTALLYNPIFKVYLGRDLWGPVNIVTALLFLFLVFKLKD